MSRVTNGALASLLGGCILVLGVVVAFGGASPGETLSTFFQGSLGSPVSLSQTLRETTPLLICGLAVFVALRAGLFNIGVEGQFLVGALTTAALAQHTPWPLALVAGVVGGALWALPAGLIKAYRGGHEVITTIMLNNIALLFTSALVAGPLRDRTSPSPTTTALADRLPSLLGANAVQFNVALMVGVVLVLAFGWWLRRTVAGYELEATGANPIAARFAGIPTAATLWKAMAVSGALGGLAGGLQVLAYEGRFYQGFSPGYGFDALGVALLAGSQAWALIPAALLFGVLASGGTAIQIVGVPKGITTVVLGIVIVVAAALRYRNTRTEADA